VASKLSFEVTTFAYTSGGSIIQPGFSCGSFGPWFFHKYWRIPFPSDGNPPVLDSVPVIKGISDCDTSAGQLDVLGVLDGTTRYYGDGLRINSYDHVQVDEFPAGLQVTLAATPNGGCSFIAWRKGAWNGTLVSTSASVLVTPAQGDRFFGVVQCSS
jgi:hypothetical protein